MTDIKKRNKWLEISAWILALLVLVFALVYYNFLAPTDSVVPFEVGEKCPDFTAKVYGGKEEEKDFVLSEHRGKVVILNFWATYCDPCVKELPHFNELQKNYKDDVTVVAFHHEMITEDVQAYIDNPNAKKDSWTDYSIIFAQDTAEITMDAKKDKTSIYAALGGKNALPTTVILNKEGTITYVCPGSITYDDLEKNFLSALNG